MLSSILGDIDTEGSPLDSIDGLTLLLGNVLGVLVGSNDTEGL
jgi:hypothetical protein